MSISQTSSARLAGALRSQTSRRLARSPTLWLILANLGVSGFLGLHGVSLVSPSSAALIRWGGNLGPYTLTGEWPRLLSSMFLHGGAVHLLLTMLLLAPIGALSERVWGRVRFMLVYLSCGLFGGLASAWWHMHAALRSLEQHPLQPAFGSAPALPAMVVVGASGAVLGAAAALLVHALQHGQASRANLNIVYPVVVLNAGMGFLVPGIDHAAHVGGALAGLALGALLALPATAWRIGRRIQSAAVFTACLALLVLLVRQPPSSEMVRVADRLRDTAAEADWIAELATQRHRMNERASAERAALPLPVPYDKAAGSARRFKGRYAGQAFRPGTAYWYAVDGATNRIARMRLADLKLDRAWAGPPLPLDDPAQCGDGYCAGLGAAGVAAARDGSWAIASSMARDALSRVDLASGAIVWSAHVGHYPRATFLSDNERYAFTLHGIENVLSVLDIERRRLLFSVLVGDTLRTRPYGSPIGAVQGKGRLFLSDPESNLIHVIDTEAPAALKRVMSTGTLSPELMALSADGRTLVAAGPGGMLAIDARTFAIADRFYTCPATRIAALAVSPDGGWIAVNTGGGRGIRVVSRASGRAVRVLPAPDGHNLLRFADDGRSLYLFTTFRTAEARSALRRYDLAQTLDVEANARLFGEVFCLPQHAPG